MLANAFAYKQWADLRALDAVRTLDATVQSRAFGFVCQQFNHMLIVEELFRARLLGLAAPHAATNSVQVPPLEAVAERLQASDNWFGEYVTTLAPACREEIIHFDFADGQAGSMSRLEILFHILNHGSYHRGAIGHALEQAGALRPADTYTVFIHAAEPARRQR